MQHMCNLLLSAAAWLMSSGLTVSKRRSMAQRRSSSSPDTTVPFGFSPLSSRASALVFSTSRETTAGCSFCTARFCSSGWVVGLVGSAVGADSDDGTFGSIVAVGAWRDGCTGGVA